MLGTGVEEFGDKIEYFIYPIHYFQYLKLHFDMLENFLTQKILLCMSFKSGIKLEIAKKYHLDMKGRKVEKNKEHSLIISSNFLPSNIYLGKVCIFMYIFRRSKHFALECK